MHGCCSLYDVSMQKLANQWKGQLGRANPHNRVWAQKPLLQRNGFGGPRGLIGK